MIAIVDFKKLAKQCMIIHDNEHAESFEVHSKAKAMEFEKRKEGMCHCHFSTAFIECMRNGDEV